MWISTSRLKELLAKIINESIAGKTADLETLSNSKQKIEDLERSIRETQHKKEMEERDLKHLLKMREEKQTIELEKERTKIAQEYAQKELHMQKTYHDKVMGAVDQARVETKELFQKVMEALPNVNVDMKKKLK